MALNILANGQTITLTIKGAGGVNTTLAQVGGSTITFPYTITADTTVTFIKHDLFTISCVIDGLETYGQSVHLNASNGMTIAPSLTPQQLSSQGASATVWSSGPAGWDAAWKSAKRASALTPSTVAFISDSTGAGQNSGDVMNANWVELLANDLASTYGRYADFYPMWTYCTRFNSNFVGTAPFSDPGAASGTSWEGGYGRAVELSATFSTVFTPPKNTNVIGFDLVYIDFSAGSFTAFPDAASPTTITTVAAGSYTAAVIKKQSFTGLTPGAHTLTINGAAGHFCVVVGVTVYYAGGAGIGFTRSAFNGIRAVDLGTPGGATLGAGAAPSTPNDKILAWAGGTAGPASVNFDGIPGQPSLALVGLILNDAILGAALAPYKTTLTRLVRSLRRGVTDCSIAFVVGSYPDPTYSDVALGGNGAFFHRWKAAIREVALANSCAIIDIDGKWMSKGLALGFQGSGNLHPTAAGYADMYSTVKGLGVTA